MQNWIVLNMKCGAGVENIMGGWKNKTVLKISLHQCSRLPPAQPATTDPGTDCAAAKPHVTNTLSVSPGDFVWNFDFQTFVSCQDGAKK